MGGWDCPLLGTSDCQHHDSKLMTKTCSHGKGFTMLLYETDVTVESQRSNDVTIGKSQNSEFIKTIKKHHYAPSDDNLPAE